MPVVSSLFCYPIKSCRGISLQQMSVGSRGPDNDRRWMVVSPRGRFITLRETPQMAQIQPWLHADGDLLVTAPGVSTLRVKPAPAKAARLDVRVWRYHGEAIDEGEDCARWFSQVLGKPCRLVRFPEDQHRSVSKKYTSLEAETRFADGYPALVTTIESLSELNRRLEEPVPMHRFRPNIVLRDCQPFEEDRWATLQSEQLLMDLVKPCDRCVAVTVDQETLEKSHEPLKTLARFRRSELGVLFGQNAILRARDEAQRPASLSVGQRLEVISTQEPIQLIPSE